MIREQIPEGWTPPNSWRVISLCEAVAQIDYGLSAPIPKTQPEDGIRIVSTADITKSGRILYGQIRKVSAPTKTVARLTLRAGDVLFNWRNSAELIGKTGVFAEQLEPHIFASFILRIRCDETKSHNLFLAHLMNYYRQNGVFIQLARRAVNQANYNRNEISVLKIPLPPYQEQRKIAWVLGVVQRAIEQQELLIVLTAELKKAFMQKLFTAGLLGEPQKQTEIGPVPQSWEVKQLGALVEDTQQVNMQSEGEREIQYIDVSSISREFLRIESTTRHLLKDAPGRARKKVKAGDVIFATVRPTLLRVARVPPEYADHVCSTAFCVLRDKNKGTLGRFVYYLTQRERFVKQLAAIESGVSYPAVTDRQVKAQLIPLPRQEEQLEIAAILEACDEKVRMHASKRRTFEDLLRTLLHQLMTAQIRVHDLDLPELEDSKG